MSLLLDTVTFTDNTADGDAIWSEFVDLSASTCDFSGNSPDDLYLDGSYTWGRGVSFACSEKGCL